MTRVNLKYFIPAGFWAVVILLLSSKAKVRIKETWLDLVSIDKFGHAFFYGVLCMLVMWGIKKQYFGKKVKIWPVILGCTVYGITIEIMQFKYPCIGKHSMSIWNLISQVIKLLREVMY